MAKVTGIGGVFFKAKDPKALAAWYAEHLGVKLEDWGGVIFDWAADQDAQPAKGMTVWHLAEADGDWFAPSTSSVMINYRVDDLDGMLAQLNAAGTPTVKGPDDEFNGRFAWVMDPEGNKVELWEPRDPA
jgi:predicted enzyme related to lactoylglutathione lyase